MLYRLLQINNSSDKHYKSMILTLQINNSSHTLQINNSNHIITYYIINKCKTITFGQQR